METRRTSSVYWMETTLCYTGWFTSKTTARDYEGPVPPCVDSRIHHHVLKDPLLRDAILWEMSAKRSNMATSEYLMINNVAPLSSTIYMRYQ
uniref:Uncharacterized protein n=1 Tax=Aegilops tauschii subsp. strangulata TaxID=200361 RepID=A0A452XBX2_AEGTS